jgi:hypothetical protein
MSDIDDGEELAKEVLAEVEKIIEGGADDGYRAPDKEVGNRPTEEPADDPPIQEPADPMKVPEREPEKVPL